MVPRGTRSAKIVFVFWEERKKDKHPGVLLDGSMQARIPHSLLWLTEEENERQAMGGLNEIKRTNAEIRCCHALGMAM